MARNTMSGRDDGGLLKPTATLALVSIRRDREPALLDALSARNAGVPLHMNTAARAATAANVILEENRRERRADSLKTLREALGPGCLAGGRHLAHRGLTRTHPCHVMSYVNGALLTGAYYAHPKAAIAEHGGDAPFYPIEDGWRSNDGRTLVILEDEKWSQSLQDEVDAVERRAEGMR